MTSPDDLVQVPAGTAAHASAARVAHLAGDANLLVLGVDLSPGVPLDGGQMADAIVWRLSGDRNRATQATGRFGQGTAMLVGVGKHLPTSPTATQ